MNTYDNHSTTTRIAKKIFFVRFKYWILRFIFDYIFDNILFGKKNVYFLRFISFHIFSWYLHYLCNSKSGTRKEAPDLSKERRHKFTWIFFSYSFCSVRDRFLLKFNWNKSTQKKNTKRRNQTGKCNEQNRIESTEGNTKMKTKLMYSRLETQKSERKKKHK